MIQTEKGEIRHRYGQYQDVFLSEKQLSALEADYPDQYADYINHLSAYIKVN